jgi:hypothetical protein
MPKAQITLPDGIIVNVSGTPDEINTVVERLRGTHGRVKDATPSARKPKRKGARLQITDLIEGLIDGGFFKKPKDLAAVKLALEEMGEHYPITTLSPTMLRQVRKRNLRRLKQDGRWMYTG